jgi:hypothetical protein
MIYKLSWLLIIFQTQVLHDKYTRVKKPLLRPCVSTTKMCGSDVQAELAIKELRSCK